MRAVQCAFAESLLAWSDKAAYEASRFFIPYPASLLSKSSTPPPVEPRAHFAGHVEAADVRTNGVTGHPFQHALVRTHGDTYDVLSAADEATPWLRPGNIVKGTFWLVARVTAGLG